jgi:UDP-3-O-[3-hydroxymyristoyl] glucosamine N-acyltransferase
MKAKTLAELARHVGGRAVGNPAIQIHSVASLEEAQEGQITFLANRKYVRLLNQTKASAVLVSQEIGCASAQIVVANPYYAFAQITILLHGHRPHQRTGLSPKASIDPSATLGPDTHVHDFVTIRERVRVGRGCVFYPGVFIGPDVVFGDECVVYPNAVIYDGCSIGHRVIIQANATIGEDGFGYATDKGVHHKIPHLGRVILEDDVEIGSNASLERGTLQDTIIGKGSKVGDLVAIGHGVQVGPGSLLVAQVGVAGSTTLGHHCVLAGQVGIVGHLKIGNRVTIAAQSGVHRSIPDGESVFGTPAFAAKKALAAFAALKSLPDYRKTLWQLEERLKVLEKSLSGKIGDPK